MSSTLVASLALRLGNLVCVFVSLFLIVTGPGVQTPRNETIEILVPHNATNSSSNSDWRNTSSSSVFVQIVVVPEAYPMFGSDGWETTQGMYAAFAFTIMALISSTVMGVTGCMKQLSGKAAVPVNCELVFLLIQSMEMFLALVPTMYFGTCSCPVMECDTVDGWIIAGALAICSLGLNLLEFTMMMIHSPSTASSSDGKPEKPKPPAPDKVATPQDGKDRPGNVTGETTAQTQQQEKVVDKIIEKNPQVVDNQKAPPVEVSVAAPVSGNPENPDPQAIDNKLLAPSPKTSSMKLSSYASGHGQDDVF